MRTKHYLLAAILAATVLSCSEDYEIPQPTEDENTESTNEPAEAADKLTLAWKGQPLTDLTGILDLVEGSLTYTAPEGTEVSARILEGEGWAADAADGAIAVIPGSIGEDALLEVALMENGKVIETYRLTVTQSGLRGSGDESDPHLISSATELAYIAEPVNKSTEQWPYNGKHIRLTRDIDLTEVDWTPIGYYWEGTPPELVVIPFCGIFDGNGHTIKGLNMQNNSDNSAQALFGSINSGTIKNLTIESPDIEGGDFVGAIAGVLWYGTIENCHVKGGSLASNAKAGGIATALFGGEIINCSVEGTNISAGSHGGGIVSLTEDYGITSVTACRFNGTLTADEMAGGIVALLYKYNYEVSVRGCYSSGSISGYQRGDSNNSYIPSGGIVGRLESGEVSACYSTAEVSGKGTNGGVVGLWVSESAYGEGSVEECYWSSASGGMYGIGAKGGNSATTGATNDNAAQVTGNDWSAAMAGMNAALIGAGWQYETGTEAFPLEIKPAN